MASAANPGSKKFSIKLSVSDSPAPVRRFFLIFLLLVLPFQFAWSAAVPYCQHEQQPARSHLGHHEHRHDASQQQDVKKHDPTNDTKLLADADCDYCHVASTPLASITPSGVTTHERIPAAIAAVDRKIQSHVPEAPERPNWSRLA